LNANGALGIDLGARLLEYRFNHINPRSRIGDGRGMTHSITFIVLRVTPLVGLESERPSVSNCTVGRLKGLEFSSPISE
jgi:hypothetical protein